MPTSPAAGVCPLCEQHGAIGAPCPTRPCKKRDYRFIDARYLPDDGRVPDPFVGRMIGDYLVVSVLGAGGFGKVYLALQQPIQMQAALKLMHRDSGDPAMAKVMLDKFRGEAQALATLAHPNIVRLLKYGVHEASPYLVMELVDGARTLKDEIAARAARDEALSSETAHHILQQVTDGLDAAHRRHIVHRDVKPENIMLQKIAGNANFVRILDFGLAKFVAERTETSMAMGTPVYMAPEQIMRRHIGAWTDLYAVGVIAYELMTGRRPFGGGTIEQIVASKLNPTFDPLTAIADLNVPRAAAGFFRRALAHGIEDRFRDAASFRHALGEAFKATEAAHIAALTSVDMTGLLDTSQREVIERARAKAALRKQREALEAERAALAAERAEIEAERRRLTERRASQPALVPVDAGSEEDDPELPPTIDMPREELEAAGLPVYVRESTMSAVVAEDDGGGFKPPRRSPWKAAAVLLVGAGAIAALAAALTSGGGSEAQRVSEPTRDGVAGVAGTAATPDTTAGGGPAEVVQVPAESAEERAWREAQAVGTISAYEKYVLYHPNGAHTEQAVMEIIKPNSPILRIRKLIPRTLANPSESDLPLGDATRQRLLNEALRELIPELDWTPERWSLLGESLPLPSPPPPKTVFIVPGTRHVLDEGMRLDKASQVALIGLPGGEIFVRSGHPVLTITDGSGVFLWGLYMNHHALDQDGYVSIRKDYCSNYIDYRPRVKSSDVIDILRSKDVVIRESELEGTGFIGLKAIDSQNIFVKDTTIHDCISEAIRLEGSTARADNVLMYRVGSRRFREKSRCASWAPSTCKGGWGDWVTFNRAIHVDAKSTLALSRATLHVPSPIAGARAFDVLGRLDVDRSLIAHDRGLVSVRGRAATFNITNSCVTSRLGLKGGDLQVAPISFPEPPAGASFVNRAETEFDCAEGRGARPPITISAHDKPAGEP